MGVESSGNGDATFYRVTNKDVYERLGTVEAKLDEALGTIRLQNGTIADLSKRTRALELRFYGVLAGLVGGFLALGVALAKGPIGG